MDAIGPEVDVGLARQRPFAPSLILVLPNGQQASHRGGREAGQASSPSKADKAGPKSPVERPRR